MASNFVAMVGETRKHHEEHLDSILRRYPGALAQTLFLGFFIAFPMQVGRDGGLVAWVINQPIDQPINQSIN